MPGFSMLMQQSALAVYDIILSFPTELRRIWKRGFGMGMVLYLSMRYGIILYVLLEALDGMVSPTAIIVSMKDKHSFGIDLEIE